MTAHERDEEAQRWLSYAADDLRAAIALASTVGVSPRHGCYLAQQAAEKAFKAALILAEVPVPRTHELMTLTGFIPSGWSVKISPEELVDISGWAVAARYPDVDGDEASEEDARAALEVAARVVEAAQQDLKTWRQTNEM